MSLILYDLGHINNLYNTTFWALIQKGGIDAKTAEKELSGTVSADKNEILFSRFGINYNNEPEMFRKGTVLFRDYEEQTSPSISDAKELSKTAAEKERKKRAKVGVAVQHIDIIQDDFWSRRPWILSGRAGRLKE
jgi:tRNA(His) guanylyltransferase